MSQTELHAKFETDRSTRLTGIRQHTDIVLTYRDCNFIYLDIKSLYIDIKSIHIDMDID